MPKEMRKQRYLADKSTIEMWYDQKIEELEEKIVRLEERKEKEVGKLYSRYCQYGE